MNSLRNVNASSKIWKSNNFYINAISDSWYKILALLHSDIILATQDFYKKMNISPVLLPVTDSSVSSPMGLGSDSVPVKIKLFGKDTYLSDSMQFNLEFFLRFGFNGVYYIMPTFRGEDHDYRHLNQFFHSEAEIVGGLDQVIDLVEDYVISLTKHIRESRFKELSSVISNFNHIDDMLSLKKFPRIKYKEALELLADNNKYFNFINQDLKVISPLGEQELIRYFKGFVWLTHPPILQAPFYQAFSSMREEAESADLLFGIGEVVGCGERHTSYSDLLNSLSLHSISKEEYDWYIEMKKQYPLKTSGFGLGVERFLLWILKHNDIRDMHILNRLK